MSVNRATVLGNLGADPRIHKFPDGSMVANFSIATSESWRDKDSGERQERTDWHRVTVWGKAAELVQRFLKKGSKVYVEGKMETREYEADGVKKYTTEIVVRGFGGRIDFVDGKPDDSDAGAGDTAADSGPRRKPAGPIDDTDIPF